MNTREMENFYIKIIKIQAVSLFSSPYYSVGEEDWVASGKRYQKRIPDYTLSSQSLLLSVFCLPGQIILIAEDILPEYHQLLRFIKIALSIFIMKKYLYSFIDLSGYLELTSVN